MTTLTDILQKEKEITRIKTKERNAPTIESKNMFELILECLYTERDTLVDSCIMGQ